VRHIEAPVTRGIAPLPNYGIQADEEASPVDYYYNEETSEEILEQGSDVLTNFTNCQPGMPGYQQYYHMN